MKSSLRREISAWLVGCLAVAVLASCADSTATKSKATGSAATERANTLGPHSVPAEGGRPVQWRVLNRPGVRKVRIASGLIGYCPDIPNRRPRITGVREIDRPRAVILTAYLIHRPKPGCAAVETEAQKVVVLRRPIRGRPLYDGSRSPPKRRWPRGE